MVEPGYIGTGSSDADAFQKDALVKLMLRGDKLYSPNPSVSTEIEAGTFADNQRVEILAYLVDIAGNVGGTVADPAAADWKVLHDIGEVDDLVD